MKISSLCKIAILSSFLLTSCNKPTPNSVTFVLDDLGTSINFHTELQQGLIDSSAPDNYIYQHEYDIGSFSNSAPNSVKFTYTVTNDKNVSADKYVISISEDESFTNPYEVTSKNKKETEVYNLKINTSYYWKLKAYHNGKVFESETATFATDEDIIRNVRVEGMENVRDLGGYVNSNGQKIKQGLIYRSAELNGAKDGKSKPTSNGKKTLLNDLKIKSEIDLRKTLDSFNEDEVYGITSSPLGKSVNYISCPMTFGGSNPITNEKNAGALKTFFESLADESNYPIVFHCVRGTDRTGALAYVIEALCGADENDMLKDYLFSNFANIGGTVRKKNIDGMSYYIEGIRNSEGDNIQEKTINYIRNFVDVSEETLRSIISILVG